MGRGEGVGRAGVQEAATVDPLMAFTLGEIEIPILALERMEELREQFGQ